ncbi:hypothetical protein [Hyphomicrobium facile]|uniref:Uncharacterized protein n=1 Tax=Hyphomicrobium facile TaxID=51670 RepID=A0A1I7NV20_9HYPH|nr:hypothetical protein [Hyphomicrobium facile]SFV38494.1 hypothetical protein SAMN04488557_3697 [Hyphomicrobium facile]
MPENIRETVPKVLKTLWDLENKLRGAAQNGVFLRREEAKQHLAEARQHLDELMNLVRSHDSSAEGQSEQSTDTGIPPSIKH